MAPRRRIAQLKTLLCAAAVASAAFVATAADGAPPSSAAGPSLSKAPNARPLPPAVAPSAPPAASEAYADDLRDDVGFRSDGGASGSPLRFVGRRNAGLSQGAKHVRQREGTKLVERRGRFEVQGERVIFYARDPEAHYVVLENLALDRVVRALEESGPNLQWSVSGSLTEYRTTNFLILERAVVKSAPGRSAPRPAESMKTANPAPVPGLLPTPTTAGKPTEVR